MSALDDWNYGHLVDLLGHIYSGRNNGTEVDELQAWLDEKRGHSELARLRAVEQAARKLGDEAERVLLALEQDELPKGEYSHLRRAIGENATALNALDGMK